MANILTMPGVSAGTESAQIVNWLKSESDQIKTGDAILEVETDKAIVEVSAEQEGILAKIIVNAGEIADVGAPIGILLSENEGQDQLDKVLAELVNQQNENSKEAEAAEKDLDSELSTTGTLEQSTDTGATESGRIFASPLARRLARNANVSLEGITGSGPHKRIIKKDVLQVLEQSNKAKDRLQVESESSLELDSSYIQIPHSATRLTIATRLTESKQTIPHFYLKANCIVDDLLNLRTQVNASSSVKVSVNDLIVKAVAIALQDVPEMNVTWTEKSMLRHKSVDISVAVSTEKGLITPVLRDVGTLSISHLSKQIKDLALRAREGKLQREEYTGDSFTISNLGMYGTEEFLAIINPPQSAILAVGCARKDTVIKDDQIQIAQVISVGLSVDHRAIDGALAAQWLNRFKQIIENPLSILI